MLVDRIGAKQTGIVAQLLVMAGLAAGWMLGLPTFGSALLLGGVLGIAGASFAVALPQVGYCVESHGSDARDPLTHHVFKDRVTFRNGHLHLADKPGFGFEIDWTAVEKYRV